MTMPVDEVELNTLFKGNFEISAHLNEADLYQLDYKIALTYELNKFLQTEFALYLKEELEHVISFIDEDIKVKMEEITRNINDSTIQNELLYLLNVLVDQLKENYINHSIEKGKYIK